MGISLVQARLCLGLPITSSKPGSNITWAQYYIQAQMGTKPEA